MTPLLIGLALFCALAGLLLLLAGRRMRMQSGLPEGAIIYSDTGKRRDLVEPLRSRRLKLAGKPDYLLERTERGKRMVIPVEVKSARAPAAPHAGHALQVGAYCLLVEETMGVTPVYGLVRYADATLPVRFDAGLRAQVLEAMAGVRADRRAATVARSHEAPERCVRCGYRSACGEEL